MLERDTKNIYKKLFLVTSVVFLVVGLVSYRNKDAVTTTYQKKTIFGTVWVQEREGFRCMTFTKPPSKIFQGCLSLKNTDHALLDYSHIFMGSLFIHENPKRVLVIGLGGAAAPRTFNILTPKTHVDVVEINPSLPRIAEQYFKYKENEVNHIFVDDGFNFVKNSEPDKYDIVLVDAFTVDYIPPSLLTNEFMQNVKRIMTQDGIVMMHNFVDSKVQDVESKLFEDNFDEYYNLTKDSTKIRVASKGKFPSLQEINKKSTLWRRTFLNVGINQVAIYSLFKKAM